MSYDKDELEKQAIREAAALQKQRKLTTGFQHTRRSSPNAKLKNHKSERLKLQNDYNAAAFNKLFKD